MTGYRLQFTQMQRLCKQLKSAGVTECAFGRQRYRNVDMRTEFFRQHPRHIEHWHASFESILILTGRIRVLSREQNLEVGEGQIITRPPLCRHISIPIIEPSLAVVFQYEADPAPELSHMMVSSGRTAWHDLANMIEEMQHPAPQWKERIAARLALILAQLLATTACSAATCAELETDELTACVHRLVSQHLANPLSLREISRRLGISQRTLSRHFLQLTGETIMDHCRRLRIERASALLIEQPDTAISAIASQAGFADTAHFGNCFRRYLGITPSAYRKAEVTIASRE